LIDFALTNPKRKTSGFSSRKCYFIFIFSSFDSM